MSLINIKDRLPNKNGFVLIYNKYSKGNDASKNYGIGFSVKMFHEGYFYKTWIKNNVEKCKKYSTVTYWMELPDEPQS